MAKTSAKKKGAKKGTNKENTSPTGTNNTLAVPKRCQWPDADNGILINRLKVEKAAGNQSESGWKKTVWVACAADLAKDGVSKYPVKTWEKCRDHFGNVCILI